MGRLFARETGGRVIDAPDSVPEEEMFHAWNAAQASGTPLLIVADTPPSEWHVALPDLASRLPTVPVLPYATPAACLARPLTDALFSPRAPSLSPTHSSLILSL